MKINFNAQFEQVDRYIRHRSPIENKDTNGFGSVIGSLLDGAPSGETIGIPGQMGQMPALDSPLAEQAQLLARYKFPKESQIAPALEPQSMPQASSVDIGEKGVKTPTLRSAARISGSKPGEVLSKYEPAKGKIEEVITRAATKHGVDPRLSLAVAEAESSLDPEAVSSDGLESKGLFQLLDSTAASLMARGGLTQAYNPFDPQLNSDLGNQYLSRLHTLFSSATVVAPRLSTAAANSSSLEKFAVAAFNAGEGRVASAQMRAAKAGKDATDFEHVSPYLPDTTRQYVQRVSTKVAELREVDLHVASPAAQGKSKLAS